MGKEGDLLLQATPEKIKTGEKLPYGIPVIEEYDE